jgi:hypothetical protein
MNDIESPFRAECKDEARVHLEMEKEESRYRSFDIGLMF